MARTEGGLKAHLSSAEAWALSVGTSVGWGSVIITCNTYLASAGIAGTILGLVVGAAAMLVIARCYAYLMSRLPLAGGVYDFAKEAFGPDFGLLTIWFTVLTYFAMLWANATSLPLFARIFWGDVFRVGRLFDVFGYEVFAGEAALSCGAVALTCVLCARCLRLPTRLNLCLAGAFVVGIAICFVSSMAGHDTTFSLEPLFLEGSAPVAQVMRIAAISPWAFIGFENISHLSEEFSFPVVRARRVLVASILTSTGLYVFLSLLSVSANPEGYATWLDYIADISNLTGFKALPAFYGAGHYLGALGTNLLSVALFALIVTSLIGNTLALSRLFFALSRDRVITARASVVGARHIPSFAFLLVAVPSLVVPFFGRVAIGWIVDVTTIGATVVYGFVSASAMKLARERGDRNAMAFGYAGIACMGVFGLLIMLPNLFSASSLEPESYFIFTIWAFMGFILFQVLQYRDTTGNFGQSAVVWVVLFSLMALTSIAWMGQHLYQSSVRVVEALAAHLEDGPQRVDPVAFLGLIKEQERMLRQTYTMSAVTIVVLFFTMAAFWVANYTRLRSRARQNEQELGVMRSVAYLDKLCGVRNRHAWAQWQEELDDRIAAEEQGPFAIVVADLNYLKLVNDTQGHTAGDAYIRSASALICELFKHSPVFRTGGDEFCVVLEGVDYESRDALMRDLYATCSPDAKEGEPSISAGIALFDAGSDFSSQPVYERADAQMYAFKRDYKLGRGAM